MVGSFCFLAILAAIFLGVVNGSFFQSRPYYRLRDEPMNPKAKLLPNRNETRSTEPFQLPVLELGPKFESRKVVGEILSERAMNTHKENRAMFEESKNILRELMELPVYKGLHPPAEYHKRQRLLQRFKEIVDYFRIHVDHDKLAEVERQYLRPRK